MASLPAFAEGSLQVHGACRQGYANITVFNGAENVHDGSYTIVFDDDYMTGGSLVLQPGQTFSLRVDQREHDGLVFYVNFTGLSVVLPQCNHKPNCTNAEPSVALLWSPDHDMYPITIGNVRDPDGERLRVRILSITSSEAENDPPGDGNSNGDYYGVGTNTAWVRAEWLGSGQGRVYAIGFNARDGHGESCGGDVNVTVAGDAADANTAATNGSNTTQGNTVGNGHGKSKAVGHADDHGNPNGDSGQGQTQAQNPPTPPPVNTTPGNGNGQDKGKPVGKNK